MSTEAHSVSRAFVVANPIGIHARPASQIVKTASQFDAQVQFAKDDLLVNGKSILELMRLAAANGEELVVTTSGSDAAAAMDAIAALFATNFGEID